MKSLKWILRIWIAIASVIGFLGGWATLAHAGKPAPATSSQSSINIPTQLPTLAPLPNFDNGPVQLQPPAQSQPFQSFMPSFRTRGS